MRGCGGFIFFITGFTVDEWRGSDDVIYVACCCGDGGVLSTFPVPWSEYFSALIRIGVHGEKALTGHLSELNKFKVYKGI